MSSRETQQIKKLKRQLEIEKSLDRLWDVSIKMKDSKELSTIINTLFNEAIKLEFGAKASDLIIIDKDTGDFEIFISGELDKNGEVLHGFYPALDHQHHKDTVEAWRRKKKLRSNQLEGRTCTSYMKKMTGSLRDHNFPDYVIEFLTSLKNVIHTDAYMKYGLFRVASVEPLNKEQEKILKRFAKVFEQTYTRFLDLKKAEEQTREAQIETALERVRATSLSMRKTSDISRVVDVYFRQLRQLNIDFIQAWINVFHLDKGYFDIWFSPLEGVHKNVTHFQMPSALFEETTIKSWRKGEPFSTLSLNSESEVDAFLKACDKVTDSDFFSRAQDAYQFDRLELLDANYKYGAVSRTTRGPATEEHKRIFQRFAKVFEQAYTRFLDLQKAEAQAREAQIEAALERVRSRSMAMHKSEEMGEVVEVVFQQMLELDLPVDHAGFILDYQEREDMHIWFASKQVKPSEITIPYFDSPHWNSFRKAKSKGEKFFSNLLDFDAKNNFYKELFKHIPPLPKKAIKNIFAQPGLVISTALQDKIGLYFENYTQTPFTEQQNDLLIRFTKVFEQAYIRFLDLQKAEAQAKEAQIEAALERVRARAMAMHSTDELADVLCVLFEQFDLLNINPVLTHLTLFDEESETFSFRMTTSPENRILVEQIIDINSVPAWQEAYTVWKESEANVVHCIDYPPEALPQVWDLLHEAMNALPKQHKIYPEDFPNGLFTTQGHCKFGYLGLNGDRKATEEENEIVKRFATEFGRMYQRFLDLQKAEAQAREAEVQLSLERVRARSMAMHSPEELSDTISVLFDQLSVLGINPVNTYLVLYDLENNRFNFRMTGKGGSRIPHEMTISFDDLPQFKPARKAWESGEPVIEVEYSGDNRKDWLKLFGPMNKQLPKEARLYAKDFPDGIFNCSGRHAFGSLGITNSRPANEEEKQLLVRFAKEFELVYNRFLDLQKAEAQAREAQIEAALERVRASSMSMHSSDELHDVLSVLFEQFYILEINPINVFLSLFSREEGTLTYRATGTAGSRTQGQQVVRLDSLDVWKQLFEKWKNDNSDDVEVVYYERDILPKLFSLLDETFSSMPPEERLRIDQFPEGGYTMHGYTPFGYIGYNHTRPPTEEEKSILTKFASEFSRVYQRFLDIQKAEAQAREAQIEAALERVRAQAMAMHRSDELQEVVAIIFEKLQELNFALDGAAFILTHLNDPDGAKLWIGDNVKKYPTYFRIPHYETDVINDFWKVRKSGTDFFARIYSIKEKNHWFEYAFKNTDLRNQPESRKNWILQQPCLTQAFASNSNSIIGIHAHHHKILTETEVDILKRFSNVFEQGYVRFMDLKKAEAQAREANIQLALERLRASTMAMKTQGELLDVIEVFGSQLTSFGINIDSLSVIHGLPERDWDFWIHTPESGVPPYRVYVPYMDTAYFTKTIKNIEEYKRTGNPIHFKSFNKEEKDEFLTHFFNCTPPIPQEFKTLAFAHNQSHVIEAFLEEVTVSLHKYGLENFSEEDIQIFTRFSLEFKQTYTRFLDLKKAEEQAREAEIETALERVRTSSMAMHNSEELGQVVKVLYQEFAKLELVDNHTDIEICIIDEDSGEGKIWQTEESLTGQDTNLVLPFTKIKELKKEFLSWRKTEPQNRSNLLFIQEYSKQSLKDFLDVLRQIPEWKTVVDSFKKNKVEKWVTYNSYFQFGMLTYQNIERKSTEIENVLPRFTKVFEQTYTRFLDLQKAEKQAREAQIEAALERVRAASMAMHHSNELNDVIEVMATQIKELGINFNTANFTQINEDQSWEFWVTTPEQPYPSQIHIPYLEHPMMRRASQMIKERTDFQTHIYDKKDKNRFFRHFFEKTIAKDIPEKRKKYVLSTPGMSLCSFRIDNILLSVGTYERIPLPDQDIKVLKRFAQVFEQAYTRFLDLQKAEAQAREAQIEAALERVRAQAMAMHNTDDLGKTIEVYFEQLDALTDTPIVRCGAGLLSKENTIAIMSTASRTAEGDIFNVEGSIDMQGHPLLESTYTHWLNQEEHSYVLRGREEIREYYGYITNQVAIPENTGEELYFYFPMFAEGSFYVVSNQEMPDGELEVFRRFSSVLSLTYRRFNDLKKAEAQAREAQIEAALERVRSRTMAMHSSDELAETASVSFQQLRELGLSHERINIGVVDEANNKIDFWVTTQTGQIVDHAFPARVEESETIATIYKGFKANKKSLVIDLKEAELERWITYITKTMGIPYNPPRLNERRVQSVGYFSRGMLIATSTQPLEAEELNILERFAAVFDQTYTRFLDLQKAEAQTREAQIETALEKVRSRTMGMQSSDELPEVANLLFMEIQELGIPAWSCGYCILLEDRKSSTCIMSSEGTLQKPFMLPHYGEASFDEWNDFVQGEQILFTQELGGEDIESHYNFMKSLPQLAPVFKDLQDAGLSLPTYQINHLCKFSHGFLLFITYEPVLESHELFQRFTKVFEQTYTRFLDLQKAEEREREAIKQSSLDRVRAKIASMRSPKDLERITPLVWEELTALGVPFFRCGIFIVREEEEMVHAYLSTPTGDPLAALHIGFDENDIGLIKPSIENWRKQKVYSEEWDQQQFIVNMNRFLQRGHIESQEKYQAGDQPPEKLVLQLVPFKQGMLYAGNSEPLTDEHIDLMKDLARAFSIAYSRYEDFVNLEKAKQRVENTLGKLKSTQTQLVHAEKMASLGELTAGIAHEIQNPLNFVNNFSDVNSELVEELRLELDNGDIEEVKAILDDLKDNEQKILHHGKRAEDIVRSMLQHSRGGDGEKVPTDINALCDEYLRLSYHGLRAKDKSFNADFKLDLDPNLPKVQVVPQDIGRVLLNLINNAFQAVSENGNKPISERSEESKVIVKTKLLTPPRGGSKGEAKEGVRGVLITVTDNGPGIPDDIRDKIFQPFFTTKPTGQGTGLGLSMSYDIVTKGHGGILKVDENVTKGTSFTIQLPYDK